MVFPRINVELAKRVPLGGMVVFPVALDLSGGFPAQIVRGVFLQEKYVAPTTYRKGEGLHSLCRDLGVESLFLGRGVQVSCLDQHPVSLRVFEPHSWGQGDEDFSSRGGPYYMKEWVPPSQEKYLNGSSFEGIIKVVYLQRVHRVPTGRGGWEHFPEEQQSGEGIVALPVFRKGTVSEFCWGFLRLEELEEGRVFDSHYVEGSKVVAVRKLDPLAGLMVPGLVGKHAEVPPLPLWIPELDLREKIAIGW